MAYNNELEKDAIKKAALLSAALGYLGCMLKRILQVLGLSKQNDTQDRYGPAKGVGPVDLTMSFIKDYKEWNEYAYKLSESGDAKAQWKYEKAYDDLILKYCRISLKYQPLAFGNESTHDPDKEKIIGSKIDLNKAIISTKHERELAGTDLSNFFEFKYELDDERWFLTSLCVVIDDERYEGL